MLESTTNYHKKFGSSVWENTPGQFHNFISGCCAVGSAPALGAGGPGFESPHSDHLSHKNRLFRRFLCVISSVFTGLMIAIFWLFKGQKSDGSMSEDSRRNRQVPNPSLTGKLPHFRHFYWCRCRRLRLGRGRFHEAAGIPCRSWLYVYAA